MQECLSLIEQMAKHCITLKNCILPIHSFSCADFEMADDALDGREHFGVKMFDALVILSLSCIPVNVCNDQFFEDYYGVTGID